MLAVEMGIPIIPIKIENIYKILPRGKFWPKFGKQLKMKKESYIKATKTIKEAVRKL